jgi:hypothetical protein
MIRGMSMARSRYALPVFFVCVSLLGCHHGVDTAAKVDIDRRVAALVPSGQAFPPPAVIVPRQLVIGQWTQHKLTNEKGELSLITYKIVGEENGAYWIEMANESYYGKTVVKLLLTLGDRTNPNTMEIHAAKFKDKEGKVFELQGPMIPANRALWQGSVNMLAVRWQGLLQEAVSVVAGNFMACFKASTDASWGVWGATSMTWMHPMVPINGLVRSVGMDRPATVELVGFGELGATSEIP